MFSDYYEFRDYIMEHSGIYYDALYHELYVSADGVKATIDCPYELPEGEKPEDFGTAFEEMAEDDDGVWFDLYWDYCDDASGATAWFWTFYRYSPNGLGIVERYDDKMVAISHAETAWNSLSKREQEEYRNGLAAFQVTLMEWEYDAHKKDWVWNGTNYDDIEWDALDVSYVIMDKNGVQYGTEYASRRYAEEELTAYEAGMRWDGMSQEEVNDLELEVYETYLGQQD